MRIAVIVSTFPKLSETFILNQITGLLKRGHTVRIFSRYHPQERVLHSEVAEYELLERTVYLPTVPVSKWVCRFKAVGWLLRFLFTHPVVLFRVLRYLLSRQEPFSYLLFFHSLPILSFRPDVIHVHFGNNGTFYWPLKIIQPKTAFLTMFHGHDLLLGLEGGRITIVKYLGLPTKYWQIRNSPGSGFWSRELLWSVFACIMLELNRPDLLFAMDRRLVQTGFFAF
ncbi:MAG TPA: glycosyltransferase [Anaerohalosphaeraceae bacterium]|nr:glycosyltransferase [Anaerohalosphaeraceae bacterium]